MKNTLKTSQTSVIITGLAIYASSAVGATLVSHWEMNNPSASPGTYVNSVAGAPNLNWDSATKPHATFEANETRFETSFDATKSTRFAAVAPSLNTGVFSFSMILDPTDMINFGNILTKDTAFAGGAAFERLGWTVQHTEFGNLEFVVRGNSGGFFGASAVLGSASGYTGGGSFGDPATYFQIAGGYDTGSGNAFFYVTNLGSSFAPVSSLTGGTASFGAGAVFDNDTLSVGTRQTAFGFDGNGAGFDLYDLQIYEGLLTSSEVQALANNPGLTLAQVPEPGAGTLLGLGALACLRRRFRCQNS